MNTESNKNRILVCLSPSPSNRKVISERKKISDAFDGELIALFVETTQYTNLSDGDKDRLNQNMEYVRQIGGKVDLSYGNDVPYQISEYAKLNSIDSIVLGKSASFHRGIIPKKSLTDKLISAVSDIDIYIIPDAIDYKYHTRELSDKSSPVQNAVITALMLTGATLIGLLFQYLQFSDSTIMMMYILSVISISVLVIDRVNSIVASAVSVFLFNFLFTYPKFTFHAYDKGYPINFIVMFITAFISGTLAMKLRDNEIQASQRAYKTKIILDTDQMLAKAVSEDEIKNILISQLSKLNRSYGIEFSHDKSECGNCSVVRVKTESQLYGYVAIHSPRVPDSSEMSIIQSISNECAIAMESLKNRDEKEKATLLAENERTRANLLQTISHDLRTPLTSISGNASNLLTDSGSIDAESKNAIYQDIYDDSIWLYGIVENLLSVSKIEDGKMNVHTAPEICDDIIRDAILHLDRHSEKYSVIHETNDSIVMVMRDAKLITQVIINIVNNAIKYSPEGTPIVISSFTDSEFVHIKISDNGPGIPDSEKDRVFDRFFTGSTRKTTSRKSLGLGLSLCSQIIKIHGGTIRVYDNQPCGSVFEFTLPLYMTKNYDE